MKFLDKFENGLMRLIDAFYSIRPRPFPGHRRLKDCKIVSHRGEHDNRTVFENTLAAFERARAAGVWGIECDLRWTRDLQPVILHDPDLARVFGLRLKVNEVTLAQLRIACPQVPSLAEVVRNCGKHVHIMLEVKAEVYPDPAHQNRMLADAFAALNPCEDFHILSLSPQMFPLLTFVPKSTFIPVAQLNFSELSRLTRQQKYGGLAGHYLLITPSMLKRHHDLHQQVGVGYISSTQSLFRELNRGIDWIFSNHAAEIQKIVHDLIPAD